MSSWTPCIFPPFIYIGHPFESVYIIVETQVLMACLKINQHACLNIISTMTPMECNSITFPIPKIANKGVIDHKNVTALLSAQKKNTRSPGMAFRVDHFFPSLEQLARLCRRSEKTHRQALSTSVILPTDRSEKTQPVGTSLPVIRKDTPTSVVLLLARAAARLPHGHFGCMRCITS